MLKIVKSCYLFYGDCPTKQESSHLLKWRFKNGVLWISIFIIAKNFTNVNNKFCTKTCSHFCARSWIDLLYCATCHSGIQIRLRNTDGSVVFSLSSGEGQCLPKLTLCRVHKDHTPCSNLHKGFRTGHFQLCANCLLTKTHWICYNGIPLGHCAASPGNLTISILLLIIGMTYSNTQHSFCYLILVLKFIFILFIIILNRTVQLIVQPVSSQCH